MFAWTCQANGEIPGTILFANTRMNRENPGKPELKHSFQLPDNLYLYAIMDKPLEKVYDSLDMDYDFNDHALNFNYALRIDVDGKEKARWLFEMPADDFKNMKIVEFVLNTSDEKQERMYSYTVNQWKNLVSRLSPGSHRIKVELLPLNVYNLNDEVPALCTGSIELEVDPHRMPGFSKEPAHILPEPTLISQLWEDQIVRASENIYPDLEPVRAIITDVKGRWSYGTDQDGNIIRRYIVASVLYRNSVIGDCEIRSSVYYQDHEGYGVF
jgi:hypothetical protein